jgi:hypothetical protein
MGTAYLALPDDSLGAAWNKKKAAGQYRCADDKRLRTLPFRAIGTAFAGDIS